MRLRTVAFLTLAALPAALCAQDSILGTYNGNYEVRSSNRAPYVGVSVVISSVEGGVVKGTGSRSTGSCRGEVPLEGTLKDRAIVLRAAEKGGRADDCGFTFRGNVEGSTLVGKLGDREITLRK